MEEWVTDLRSRGLLGPAFEFSTLVDEGRPVGRLRVGPGAEALITEGGRLVFQLNPQSGTGTLEVVAEDRFYREFQPLR
jgi:antitoxin (DNA-binding transcriptional repressor) of toxin-antitoxin stability system